MILKLITAPASEPVSLSDAEGQRRCDLTAESATVGLLISAVRQRAENTLRRALIYQTWDMVLDGFTDVIEIPKPPLVSVSTVKYYDTDGTLQTLAGTEYTVDTDSTPGRVYPAYGKAWPTTQDRHNAVRIQFVCGYGATGASVPACIRQWMLLNIASLHENRESIVVGTKAQVAELDTLADSLLDPERWELRV